MGMGLTLVAYIVQISFDLLETHQQEINFPLEAENKVIYSYFSSLEINGPLVHILMYGLPTSSTV